MDLLSREELRELVAHRSEACVSILMPTHHGADSRQDPIRLHNLLEKAQDVMAGSGMRRSQAGAVLDPARRLLEDSDFWRNIGLGLAVFAAPEYFRAWRLPLAMPEKVALGSHFVVQPLLPLLADGGTFFVLAISAKSVRVLHCTQVASREIPLSHLKVPQSLAEALQYDMFEKQPQFHPAGVVLPGAGGRAAIAYHAQAGFDLSIKKDELERFLLGLERGVAGVLRGQHAPLVLAGVQYLLDIYRMHNTYPNLAPAGIAGNPDRLAADDLGRRAWRIVEPLGRESQRQAIDQYLRAMNLGLASDNIRHILPAAFAGRVGILLTAAGATQWGHFDDDAGRVSLSALPTAEGEDLGDLAAVHTLLHGGRVYCVQGLLAPSDATAAAVYRY